MAALLLSTRIENIGKEIALINERTAEIEKKNKEILELEDKITNSQSLVALELQKNMDADKWMGENPKKDTSSFEETIKNTTDTNNKYNAAQALIKNIKELESLKEQYGEQTVKIELTRQAIQDCIKDTFNDPESVVLEGLAFDNEQLVYNGLPVHPESQSESEIMALGAKLKLCENKDLGILLLERTESFGEKRWQEVLKMCKDNNFQLIGELVQRGKEQLQIEIMAE